MNARLQNFFAYQALEQQRLEAPEAGVEAIDRETATLLPDIEPAIRQRIQMLIRHGQSNALVPLEEEGFCGHCHRRLTPRESQQVKLGDVIACERCNRLVYSADEVAA